MAVRPEGARRAVSGRASGDRRRGSRLRDCLLALIAVVAWGCSGGGADRASGGAQASADSGMPPADSFGASAESLDVSVSQVLPPGGARTVTYVASEFAFQGPKRIPAGVVTIRLVNRGAEPHHLQIARLPPGQTASDFVARTAAGGRGALPAELRLEGGPGGVAPGGDSNATLRLEPGAYAFTCWVSSSADRVPHLAKGMAITVEVVAEEGPARPESLPEADGRVTLVDYDFELPGQITAGVHTFRVVNEGSEPHEIVVFQLAPGASLGELVAWIDEGRKGRPPGRAIGGTAALEPETENSFSAELAPGEYALMCFVPDDEDGRMHFAHGMAKQITVTPSVVGAAKGGWGGTT